jgi:hypothetical protein
MFEYHIKYNKDCRYYELRRWIKDEYDYEQGEVIRRWTKKEFNALVNLIIGEKL